MVRGMYMYMCMHAIMCVNPPLKYVFMHTFTCHNTAKNHSSSQQCKHSRVKGYP